MAPLPLCLILFIVPAALIAVGYGMVPFAVGWSPAERVASAILVGLAALIWSVSVINLVVPLSGIPALVAFFPWLLLLLRRGGGRRLARDFRALVGDHRAWAAAAATLGLLAAVLRPQLTRPDLVYFDGSAGHDGFFWVVGAEYLTRSSYLAMPPADPTHPLFYPVGSIIGLQPAWGRMGAEGLLAVFSAVSGLSPLKLYLAISAALFVPWLAALFLTIKTFFADRWPVWFAFLVPAGQPLFVFFHGNANFPNLVGVVSGTGAVLFVARALTEPFSWKRWIAAIPLLIHATLCSYPEAFPVVILAIAMLLARRGAGRLFPADLSIRSVSALVVIGLCVNPASTIRAWYGFFCSLGVARAAIPHPDIFAELPGIAKFNAMATLSVPVAHDFSRGLEIALGLLLVVAAGFAIQRAKDRIGTLIVLSGVVVLAFYTLGSGFGYGWQKTVQFSGVFVAALFSAAILALGRPMPDARKVFRTVSLALATASSGLLIYATVANLRELDKWSHRKAITRDWYAVQEFSRRSLANRDVLVDSSGFARPFFSTMWAAYFLQNSRVFFTADSASAGYLHPDLQRHPPERRPQPEAVLVESHSALAVHAAAKQPFGSLCFVLRNSAILGVP